MSFMTADTTLETTTTTGTGTLSLDGTAPGYQTLVSGLGNGNASFFVIRGAAGSAADGQWEVCYGTVTDSSPDTLSRDHVLASSNGGAAVNFAAGTKQVFCIAPAESLKSLLTGGRGDTLPGYFDHAGRLWADTTPASDLVDICYRAPDGSDIKLMQVDEANKTVYPYFGAGGASDTPLFPDNNLSDVSNATTARSNLGLQIGADVQAHDSHLDQIAGITPSAGDILYYDGGAYQNLGAGTNGQSLQISGGNPAWVTPTGGGMTLITSFLVNTSTNFIVDSTAAFDGTYKALRFIIKNLQAFSDETEFGCRFLQSGTVLSGASDYAYSNVGATSSAEVNNHDNSGSEILLTRSGSSSLGNGIQEGLNLADLTIWGSDLSGFSKTITGLVSYRDALSGRLTTMIINGALIANGFPIDGVEFLSLTGGTLFGHVDVYGIN